MIHLAAASIWTTQKKLILAPTTETFLTNERIGILAASGSGKTTLAKTLAGQIKPQKGWVIRLKEPDTILGQENLLHPDLNSREAVLITAELLGLDPQKACDRALEFCMTPVDYKIKELSPVAKSALAFALSIQINSHWIIADDRLVPNDPALRVRAEAAIRHRLLSSGLILISKNASLLGKFCERFFVLTRGQLIPSRTLSDANTMLNQSLEPTT